MAYLGSYSVYELKGALMAGNKKHRQPIKDKPKVNVSTMLAREFELTKQFEKERDSIIQDTCEMYSIAL